MITLKNDAGITKTVKVGISWTVFFWGFFVPITRGDWKWAGIMVISEILLAMLTMGFGTLILHLVFVFKYNDFYINDLKEKGYRVV